MKTPVALLAFLLLVLACLFGVTRAATIEDNIAYQECLASPITCTTLCLAPPRDFTYNVGPYNSGESGIPSEIMFCRGGTSGWTNQQPSEPLNLTGTIPTEIGRLTRLIILDLGVNDLSGTIPTQIGRLTRLKHILLDKNDLEGTIPTEVGVLQGLSTFEVHDNHDLCGPMPYMGLFPPYRNTIYPDVSEPLTNLGEVCPTAAPTTAAPTTAAPTTAAPTTAAPTGAVVADQTQAPEGAASKAADTISKSGRVVLLAAAAGAAAANIVGIL